MSFNFFPINYKPLHSLAKTRVYISQYKELLDANIRQKLNALYIEPPILTSINESWNAHQRNVRYISFDNKYTSEVNEVISDPSNYMRYALINFINNHISFYTSMMTINRDAQEEDGEIMVNHNYFIEYRLVDDSNPTEQVLPLLKNILSIIGTINTDSIFKDVKAINYSEQKIKIISVEELHKQYPLLSLKNALSRFVAVNGLTYVSNVYHPIANGKRLLDGIPTTDDYEKSGILYTYNEITHAIMPLIKMAIRPTYEVMKKQIILDTPGALDEQIYNHTIFNPKTKFPLSVGIQIFFSNLMFINLQKYHLCEILHSPCSSELSKYFKDNEIEVM